MSLVSEPAYLVGYADVYAAFCGRCLHVRWAGAEILYGEDPAHFRKFLSVSICVYQRLRFFGDKNLSCFFAAVNPFTAMIWRFAWCFWRLESGFRRGIQ